LEEQSTKNLSRIKEKKIKKYFLTIYGVTESPVLDYENMVHFLLGIIRGLESSKKYNLKTKNEIFK
jgi:hypothetical protein